MTSFRSRCAIHVFLFHLILIAFAISYGVIPAHADQSQSFAWVADTRGDANNDLIDTTVLTPIVDSILALSPAPKVVIFGGDAAYRGGNKDNGTNLNKFREVFTDRFTAAGIPSAFAIGNHELYTEEGGGSLPLTRQQSFQGLFNTASDLKSIKTQNGPDGFDKLAFSFHVGNSLFIIADSFYATTNATEPSYGINAAQQAWINGLLKDNKAAHTFFLSHIPAWSPKDPSAENNMKDTWQTITTSGNANNTNASILFAGHQHLYYRTQHDGTYEVLAGSGGAPIGCEQGESCNNLGPVYPGDVFALRYNYAVTSINGREVTVSVFDQANSSIDIFSFFDNSGVNNTIINNAVDIVPDADLQQPTGILAASGNTITNSASISNVFTGIDAVNNNTITNSGSITPLSGGNGILVYDNNTITNTITGSITGDSTGLWGIRVNTGNTINNNGTITVSGKNSIAFLAQGDNNTLTNTGTLSASGTGSYAAKFMGTGNGLVNSNTGIISGNLWFDAGDNTLTNNGTINGSGGLYKAGSGTLTLRGITSYTGGTYLNGGSINITQNASLGALSGGLVVGGGTLQLAADVTSDRSITLNARGGTFDTNGNALTLSGLISGTGSLTKAGAGTLELTGVNTYSGGTAFNGGSINITQNASLGALSGGWSFDSGRLKYLAAFDSARSITINAGGGTFDTNGYGSTLSGNISGSGSFTKTGTGTVTLQGVNTYAGNTTIQEGVLKLSGGFAIPDGSPVSLSNVSGVKLDINGTNETIGSLSGGGTTGGNITLGTGQLTVQQIDNNTYSGIISDTGNVGSVVKSSSGALTLTGANTYGGGTTVNGGLLLVNNISGSGTGTGSVTVGSSGSLGGAGTIGGNLINSGIVAPGSSGSSIGTLTISGGSSYTQNSTGKLQVKIGSPASNDLLKVGGSANIDGTLETLWQGGAVPANKTVFGTIISTAAGVSGKFGNIIGNKITPTLFFQPQYDRPNEVYLMTERDYTASNLISSLTGNQLAIAQMLNPLANSASGDLNTVLGKIDDLTTNAQVAAAFDQLSPIASVAQTNMTSGVASFQTGNVASRLGDLRQGAQGFSFQGLENLDFLYPQGPRQPFLLASNSDDLQGMIPVTPDPKWGFFVRGNLVLGDQKDTAEQRGYDFKNGGLTLGTDYRFSEQFVCGALFGMNAAKSWINDAGSTVKLDGYTLGLYGTYFRNDFYIDTQAGYGWNNFDNSRRIVFPGIDRTATSSPSGSQVTAYGGTGYDFNFGSWTVGPSLTFQYLWMGVNGYTESGADSLNLQVDRQTTESYQGSAGIKGSWNWKRDKLRFVPRLWGFYRHEFGNVNPATNAALAQGSSAFTIASVAPERNYFNVGTGVNVHWTDRVLAYLNYDAQLGQSAYSAQSITIGLRLQF